MIIGLVILAIVTVLLIFGVARRSFKSMGVAYPAAFVIVGGMIGCAFIPSFKIGMGTFNVGGFLMPIALGVVFLALAGRGRELMRAAVTATAVAALYIAVRLLIQPIASDVVLSIVLGFLCGAGAYLIGKTRLAAVTAVFCGSAVGEVVSSGVYVYMNGFPMRLGSYAVFDAVVIAAVFAVLLYELIAAIKKSAAHRKKLKCEGACEQAEEFDENEYKKYFDE